MEQCATQVDDDDAHALATNMLDYTARQIIACNLILHLRETTMDAGNSEGKVWLSGKQLPSHVYS